MKGRGVRTIDPTDLQAVTEGATSKDHFVIVDCVGLTDEDRAWAETRPLDRKPSVALKTLLQEVAMGIAKPDAARTVGARLTRLEQAARRRSSAQAVEEALGQPVQRGRAARSCRPPTPTDHEHGRRRRRARGREPTEEELAEARQAARRRGGEAAARTRRCARRSSTLRRRSSTS